MNLSVNRAGTIVYVTTFLSQSENPVKLDQRNIVSSVYLVVTEYQAKDGQYIGRFQLTSPYLNGDYSVENQERTAYKYVSNRYGSWTAAKAHWEAYGWY